MQNGLPEKEKNTRIHSERKREKETEMFCKTWGLELEKGIYKMHGSKLNGNES